LGLRYDEDNGVLEYQEAVGISGLASNIRDDRHASIEIVRKPDFDRDDGKEVKKIKISLRIL